MVLNVIAALLLTTACVDIVATTLTMAVMFFNAVAVIVGLKAAVNAALACCILPTVADKLAADDTDIAADLFTAMAAVTVA